MVVANVESPWWSERAIVAGSDAESGEVVTFALAKDLAKKIAESIAAGEVVTLDVPAGDVLFRHDVLSQVFPA